eukprot:CAMPEP_0198583386 /NCGR_PEP_ID=MMETSP1462-20131121/126682_1 /TAXON_ID=1333877 /ORGANISM="Brandtodinium nutriculum, Strain RCC3387" /LENGTH=256 /DNA_ID=CAMNT_0044314797 /DNA_START=11 /DNA_END=777 /DNA_ORIENTATION=+
MMGDQRSASAWRSTFNPCLDCDSASRCTPRPVSKGPSHNTDIHKEPAIAQHRALAALLLDAALLAALEGRAASAKLSSSSGSVLLAPAPTTVPSGRAPAEAASSSHFLLPAISPTAASINIMAATADKAAVASAPMAVSLTMACSWGSLRNLNVSWMKNSKKPLIITDAAVDGLGAQQLRILRITVDVKRIAGPDETEEAHVVCLRHVLAVAVRRVLLGSDAGHTAEHEAQHASGGVMHSQGVHPEHADAQQCYQR